MSDKTVDSRQEEKARDPDFVKAEIAMKRAALKARKKAHQTGSAVVILKNGQLIEEQKANRPEPGC